jgi:hypothetical protein
MCVWQRIDRLERSIDLLEQQTHGAVELHLWNNNYTARDQVDTIAATASLPVSVTHSARNAGGFGRFYLARDLARAGHDRVIFVDDDQVFAKTLVADLAAEHEPGTMTGFWAFRFSSSADYGSRVPARPGERVKYCGTGGMIADAKVFLDDRLYLCPRRFWFAEDLWLSHHADRVLGWTLRKSKVEIEMDDDGLDQFQFLYPTKDGLFRRFVRDGWNVLES